MASRQEKRELSIPIIPMAGVALIIVLMMMITAQELLTHEDTPVNVPQAHTMQRKTEDNATVAMLVDENGKRTFFLNDDEMELPTIKTELADTILKNEYLLVVIRADSTAPTQWVMELLELARDAGAQRVALSTKRVKEEDEATETE